MTGTEMTGTEMTGTEMTGTEMTGTEMTGTEITGTEMTGTEITGTEMTGTELIRTELTELGTELINAKKLNLNQVEIRGVLFDMDGILLDSEKVYTRFWREAANVLGYPMTTEQALGMRSLNSKAGEQKIHSYFGENASYQDIRNKRIELMDAFVEKEGIELKPGVFDLLDYLNEKKIKAAIATSSPLERTLRYLAPHGLEEKFDGIVTGYMVERGKPEPDIYQYAAKKLGLDVKHCLVLEDSPSGIRAGSAAGCITVMVPDQDQPTDEIREMLFAKADSLFMVKVLIEHFAK